MTYAVTSKRIGPVSQLMLTFIMQQLVKLPRLAQLIRLCPKDPGATYETIILAQEIQRSSARDEVKNYLQTKTKVTETTYAFRNIIPLSFQFGCLDDFIITLYYYTCQLILCGQIQTLLNQQLNCELLRPLFHQSVIETQDIQAAESIAMCLQYAKDTDSVPPLCQLHILDPLQLSYGSWDRALKRTQCQTIERATDMKVWCVENYNLIRQLWNLATKDEGLIKLNAGRVAGEAIETREGKGTQ